MQNEALFPWGTAKRYNTFSNYQKKLFGERVQKVTIDAGFTCPNRDGTVGIGGCIYCNNDSFNPSYNTAENSITHQIEEGVEYLKRRYRRNLRKFIVYFQPHSNTYAPLNVLKKYYEEALAFDEVVGLTIGTRPDCIDDEKLDYLQNLAENFDITIEYGLESLSDDTLKRVNRGHDVETFFKAIEMTKNRGIKICAHLIIGFPWEEREQWIKSADVLSQYPLDFIKIHHLHIVKNTVLAAQYKKEPFHLLTKEEYMDILADFLERLNPEIVIQRLFGESPPNMLIAPNWGIRNSLLLSIFDDYLKRRDSWQGKLFTKTESKTSQHS
jgi:radical SAM protein (TIGR01212 family)